MKKRKYQTAVALGLIFTLLTVTGVLAAAAGTLDTSFDGDGLVTTTFTNCCDSAYAIAIQQNGKLIAVGSSNPDFGVARYNNDGSLDTSFDTDGRVDTPFGPGESRARGVAIQNDGKIIVVGNNNTTNNGSDYEFALARYNSNGSLDTSFDGDGKVTTNIGSNYDYATDVAIQPDGKIVVVGYTNVGINNDHIAVLRYNINGSLDTTFDNDGIVTTSLGDSGFASSVIIQTNGKIVVGGNMFNNSIVDLALIRYNSNGSLDTSFDTDGIVSINFNNQVDRGGLLALQPNGKILIGGHYISGNSNGFFTLARYNSNGSLDTSFGTGGKVTTLIGTSYTTATAIALQSNGKIILVGHDRNIQVDGYNFILVRYTNNGSLDTSFDADGKISTDFGINKDDIASDVAIQADGKIVVAGERTLGSGINAFALARYIGDPIFSSTSIAAQDGWMLESSETSNIGSSAYTIGSTLTIGDKASKQQYRSILSFNTGSLPDTAVINSVTLKVKKQAVVGGGDPVATFQGFMIDLKNGFFGPSELLQVSDFQDPANKILGPVSPAPINNWYSINLTSGKVYINKLATNGGLTQIRLRFNLDDNNDAIANYLSLYSGNAAAAADRPQLVITYTLP